MNNYISVKEAALKWNVAERTVRNYCQKGKIEGAIIKNGEWQIPESFNKPKRININKDKNHLLERLREEKRKQRRGGIYHRLQIDITYNSNHMEGNKLSHDETRYIFETRTIGTYKGKTTQIDDVIEVINHFTAFDRIIDFANYPLSERFIKELHKILKTGTSDAQLSWFAVGDYKKVPNEVGDRETIHPDQVANEMAKLVERYSSKKNHTIEEIIEFHVNFERIHPFQDGNGRVGRLIAFKECLKNNIVPFVILDEKKEFYYRGLKNWDLERGWLIDTCLDGQDTIKRYLDYFNIEY
jgi:Fic family protein